MRSFASACDRGLRHCPTATPTAFFEQSDQRAGISARVSRCREHRIVARQLPLPRKASINPPDSRMKEKERSCDFLKEVGPSVISAKVRELVDENGIELRLTEQTVDAFGQ